MALRLDQLPPDLPEPLDDGACDHLPSTSLPVRALASTDSTAVSLGELTGKIVIYAFPKIGRPGEPLPNGWDATPGARGCTPQSLAYAADFARLTEAGLQVFGLSARPLDELLGAASRLKLPQPLLSDEGFTFSDALRLPRFEIAGTTYLRRLTLLCDGGRIDRVVYPVFPPGTDAAIALDWAI
ncbi:MAG: redoxin family protein [Solirubrobacterales bacterium]